MICFCFLKELSICLFVGFCVWNMDGWMDLDSHVDVFFTSGLFLNESRLLEGVRGLLGNIRSMLTSEPKLVSMTAPNFGCSRGYHLNSDGEGCGKSVYVVHS